MEKLLDLRKLTTAIADLLQGQLKAYLTTLQPLFLPDSVLGHNARPNSGAIVKRADKVFADLQTRYLRIAATKLYNLPRELESPVGIVTAKPEILQVDYAYEAESDGESRKLTAVSPLKWCLAYAGSGPARLRTLLAQGDNVNERELQEMLLQTLVMDLVVRQQAGLTAILEALGFKVSSGKAAEFGELPLTYISAPITTRRPPDKVMLRIAEVSGSPVFEEVVRIEDIVAMKTPMKDRLLEQARTHAGGLLETVGGSGASGRGKPIR
jgi:hypothetical protein